MAKSNTPSKKFLSISVSFTPELVADIDKIAEEENRNRSAQIQYMLKKAVKKYNEEN